MAQFKYHAQTERGTNTSGTLEATSREAALEVLHKQKLKPLSIDEVKTGGFSLNMKIGGNTVKSKDLVIFTRQLSVMVSAGVPLMRALTTLAEQTESEALQKVLSAVSKDVQSGISLGDAFAKHPDTFSDVYVNMVKAGEAGGILDDILKRLALQQEKNASIKKKVKSAMTYPVILLVITIGAFFALMLFIVPQLGQILYELGGPDAKLPTITIVLLGISDFMKAYWYLIIGGGVGAAILFRRYIKTPAGRSQFHHAILKVPIVGTIVAKLAVARFSRTFAALIGAGVSILEALRVTGEAIGNEAFKQVLEQAALDVKNGQPLSAAISKSELFPGIVPQMLGVGEETGQTDQVLIKVADFYEEEVDALIDGISSVIEPVMIVIMGGLVGVVAAGVMGPMASLSQNVK